MNRDSLDEHIKTILPYARTLYRSCKNVGGEYSEISREVRALYDGLHDLSYEVEKQNSFLGYTQVDLRGKLFMVLRDCDGALQQLDRLLISHGRLRAKGRLPRTQELQTGYDHEERDELGIVRMELVHCESIVSKFLEEVQPEYPEGVASETADDGTVDLILNKVSQFSTRLGQRSNSARAGASFDDEASWRFLKEWLVTEKIPDHLIRKHESALRAYVKTLNREGSIQPSHVAAAHSTPPAELRECPIDAKPAPLAGSEDVLPSVGSLYISTTDDNKMRVDEENLKFPYSIKQQIAEDAQAARRDSVKQLAGQKADRSVRLNLNPEDAGQALSSRMSSSNYDPAPPVESSSSNIVDRVVMTSDLPSSKNLDVPKSKNHDTVVDMYSPVASPSSYRSSISFDRPTSPTLSESIGPVSIQPSLSSNPWRREEPARGAAPWNYPSNLAPDSKGRPIAIDAMWTKIRRSLVSPEVFAQDGLRYEARPDFVAVLGILSPSEIQAYAERTLELRAARTERLRVPRHKPRQSSNHHYHNDDSSSSRGTDAGRRGGKQVQFDTSEDDTSSDDGNRRQRKHRSRRRRKRRTRSSEAHHTSSDDDRSGEDVGRKLMRSSSPGYLQQSPGHHPQSAGTNLQSQQNNQQSSPYSRQSQKNHRPQSANRDHRTTWPQPSAPTRHKASSSSSQQHDRRSGISAEKKRSWKDNLTAASVGGAAGSLMSVLVEAAQEL